MLARNLQLPLFRPLGKETDASTTGCHRQNAMPGVEVYPYRKMPVPLLIKTLLTPGSLMAAVTSHELRLVCIRGHERGFADTGFTLQL